MFNMIALNKNPSKKTGGGVRGFNCLSCWSPWFSFQRHIKLNIMV